ncbi:YhcH/YjgK/YiaL family protein [Porphyromonas catoniae]|uniref:YhcH/YjgK/YiaL family protein n=1 Tax=Porphyromonas catoniae TaxID=41976 RepID=UPI0023F3D5AE|nr:YhcH/YjgK/YiaL family protein [Porphyromonas catoniae]
MILGNLQDSARYDALHPLFREVFEYIKTHDLLHTETGRIELRGDDLFINNVEPTTKSKAEQPLEVHETYLDIHVLLEGKERIGWIPASLCHKPQGTFDKENDFILYDDEPTSYVDLLPGQFAIVYPEDAHAPMIGDGDTIRKLIVKVRVTY